MNTSPDEQNALTVVGRARNYLATLPASVSGHQGHDDAFRAACVLVQGFALSVDTAFALLAGEFNARCKPPWSAAELRHKIQSAAATESRKPRGYLRGERFDEVPHTGVEARPNWPEVDEARRREIISGGVTVDVLRANSLAAFESVMDGHVANLLFGLFFSPLDPDPLLCLAKDQTQFATRPLTKWIDHGGLSQLSFIVPSPMSARTGYTRDGRESERTSDNTGTRRFLVVEFDAGTLDEQTALLWNLASFAPLVLVVHSGGKSLHGWYFCEGESEEDLCKFMQYAVSLGADRRTWTKCQLVRLPSGQRDTGERQRVLYFDPGKIRPKEARSAT